MPYSISSLSFLASLERRRKATEGRVMSRRTALESELLKQVVRFYLDSGDFNGIGLRRLLETHGPDALEIVKILVQKQTLEVISGSWDLPYIKRMPVPAISKQLEVLQPPRTEDVCVYPATKYMKRALPRNCFQNRPFTRLLALGHPQLEPMFFELGVLYRYQSDPRYSFEFRDLAGHIVITDKYYRSREMPVSDKVLIEHFGLGSNPKGERVAVVFLRYLSPLTARHQQHWDSHRVKANCKVESNYYLRSICGQWTDGISVYAALLKEILHINKMCDLIGLPHLFIRDFSDDPPKGFGLLMKPTSEEYFAFVHTLDKLISENLNPRFFEAQGLSLNNDETNERKGTLSLLKDWLTKRIRLEDADGPAKIVAPLRQVRKERQPRAHSVVPDDFSRKYQRRKQELIKDVYISISNVRILFQTHPDARNYEFPESLDPKNIVSY
jgi:hypothetical protein